MVKSFINQSEARDYRIMIGYYEKAQMIIPEDQNGGEIWISGRKFAENEQQVQDHGFKMVCSCIEGQFKYSSEIHPYHIRFPIIDDPNFDIKAYFEPIFEVIETSRKAGRVLIHSEAGISRCGTLVIAYLIQRYNKSYKEALEMVRAQRPCVQPNDGFLKQLEWWQKFCRKLI